MRWIPSRNGVVLILALASWTGLSVAGNPAHQPPVRKVFEVTILEDTTLPIILVEDSKGGIQELRTRVQRKDYRAAPGQVLEKTSGGILVTFDARKLNPVTGGAVRITGGRFKLKRTIDLKLSKSRSGQWLVQDAAGKPVDSADISLGWRGIQVVMKMKSQLRAMLEPSDTLRADPRASQGLTKQVPEPAAAGSKPAARSGRGA